MTVQGLVELYLTERIEDRKTKDGKIIPGARKPKGQAEGAFEKHSFAYLSDKDVARLANRFILDVLLKGLGR